MAATGEQAVAALAALDIGTNSFHLVVARLVEGERFETLTREKEVVRLGHGGGDMKELSADAIERGLGALRRMRHIADSYGAELRAVATSAVREAANAADFIDRAHDEAGVVIEVISGTEEARLIHLGVLQAVPVFERRILLVDIGGGSTELLIGERGDVLAVRSLKLGAVRLTDRFFPEGRVTPKKVTAARGHIRDLLTHFARDVDEHGFEVAVASSGTAETVARITHAAHGQTPLTTYNCALFSAGELGAALEELIGHRDAESRASVPGLEAARADIVVAGALILNGVAEAFGVEEFVFSEGALRDGVLVDTWNRLGGAGSTDAHRLQDATARSIRQLAERCDDDPEHSAHVATLAGQLFDGLRSIHGLGDEHRRLLDAGARLANVGLVVAHSKHHLHAYYVIRNSELAGLTDREIELIAQIARYHRKSAPKSTHAAFAALRAEDQELVRVLAGILRVAIGLDRSHRRRVRGIRVSVDPKRVTVFVTPDPGPERDVGLELYAANERKDLLERLLGRRVELLPDPS